MENMNTIDTLAGRCIWARTRLGLSQGEVATRAGVSKGVIANVEVGRNVTIRNLTEVAQVLQVYPRWLATGDGQACVEEVPSEAAALLVRMATEDELGRLVVWLSSWRNADDVTRSMIESVFAVAGREAEPLRLQA